MQNPIHYSLHGKFHRRAYKCGYEIGQNSKTMCVKSDFILTSCYWFSLPGNKKTLMTIPAQKNIDIRKELLKFHDTYYSSNIMGLVVVGRGEFTNENID